jgi:hypothetical protein
VRCGFYWTKWRWQNDSRLLAKKILVGEMNEHKERPILFSGPMIRAILDGRKTQTRRVIKHRENRWECGDDGTTGKVWPFWPCYVYGEPEPIAMPCPYGVAGDRLWVRETWFCATGEPGPILCYYRADGNRP